MIWQTRRADLVLIAAVGLAWLWLYLNGYPRPHVDDLFFTGAGVSLAEGGGYKNPWIKPWLERHNFDSEKFYVQTPFYPYLLAGWLKIFGVGSEPILALQCLAGAIGSLLLVDVLRKAGITVAMSTLMLALYITLILSFGLRPEPFGILCILAAVLCWFTDRKIFWFLGCFFGACAPIFTPFLQALIIPIGVVWFAKSTEKVNWIKDATLKVLAFVCGTALAVLAFLISIKFEFREYLECMQAVASSRIPAFNEKIKVFFEQVNLGYEPFFRLPAALLPWICLLAAWKHRKRLNNIKTTAIASLALAGFMALGIFSYTQQLVRYLPYVSLLISGIFITEVTRKVRIRWLQKSWFTAAGLCLLPTLVFEAFHFPRFREHPHAEVISIREAVKASQKTLYLDEVAIRYFYDFRPPTGSRDWLHGRDQDSAHQSLLKDKPETVSWLVNKKKLSLYIPDAGVTLQNVIILGKKFGSFSLDQFQVLYYP